MDNISTCRSVCSLVFLPSQDNGNCDHKYFKMFSFHDWVNEIPSPFVFSSWLSCSQFHSHCWKGFQVVTKNLLLRVRTWSGNSTHNYLSNTFTRYKSETEQGPEQDTVWFYTAELSNLFCFFHLQDLLFILESCHGTTKSRPSALGKEPDVLQNVALLGTFWEEWVCFSSTISF